MYARIKTPHKTTPGGGTERVCLSTRTGYDTLFEQINMASVYFISDSAKYLDARFRISGGGER